MLYSVVFCYRNTSDNLREEQLKKTIPRVRDIITASGHECEIIISEQNDSKKFRRGNLLNEGVRVASGEIVILHDIDYYPEQVTYYDGESDVFLPVKRVEFVTMDLSPRDVNDIPGGYRHFKDSVDNNFYGGVITFKKEFFIRINGFSTEYVGWGFEDMNLRNRIHAFAAGVPGMCKIARSPDNLFYALAHPDSGPSQTDPDFVRNIQLAHNANYIMRTGLIDVHVPVVENSSIPPHLSYLSIDKWIKCSQFEYIPPINTVISSNLEFLNE